MSLTLVELQSLLASVEFAFPGKVVCEGQGMMFGAGYTEPSVRILVRVRLFWGKDNTILGEGKAAVSQIFESMQIIPLSYVGESPERALEFVRRLFHEAVMQAVDEGIYVHGCQPFAKYHL